MGWCTRGRRLDGVRVRFMRMGVFTESAMLDQLKKGQGETNDRLDRLIAAVEALTVALNRASPPAPPVPPVPPAV